MTTSDVPGTTPEPARVDESTPIVPFKDRPQDEQDRIAALKAEIDRVEATMPAAVRAASTTAASDEECDLNAGLPPGVGCDLPKHPASVACRSAQTSAELAASTWKERAKAVDYLLVAHWKERAEAAEAALAARDAELRRLRAAIARVNAVCNFHTPTPVWALHIRDAINREPEGHIP